MKRFQRIYTFVFALALIGFSLYAVLDTFTISRVYRVVEPEAVSGTDAKAPETEVSVVTQPLESYRPRTNHRSGGEKDPSRPGHSSSSEQQAEPSEPAPAEGDTPVETAADPSRYEAEDMTIEIQTYRQNDTTLYVADIRVSSPTQLKTAFARSSYGRNVTAATSATAESVGAVLAVNGDNYGSRERGYVIRNGVLYRDTVAKDQEDLVIWDDGSFEIIREDEVSAEELLKRGAVQVFSFGPGLVENGEIIVDASDEVDRAMASNPRTAIGIIEEGHYVLVVSDGRSGESEGLSLYELASFLQQLGVQTAYNLDGGGSSTLVFGGEVLNEPSGRGGAERAVTDIVYLA